MTRARNTADQINRVNSSAADATAITIDSSENVGINTSAPASLIHGMSGDLFLTANSTSADSGQGIYFQSTTSGWATNVAHAAIFGKRTDASNGYLKFDTRGSGNSAERMRIDASGATVTGELVSTSLKATNFINIQVDDAELYLTNTANNRFHVFARDASNNLSLKRFDGSSVSTDVTFDSSGNVLVGKTANNNATGGILYDHGQAYFVADSSAVLLLNRLGSDGIVVQFYNDSNGVGSISVSGSSTAYNTSSDYRLKTDVQPMTGATARVLALNPVNFKWIADGTRVDGFLAHEAQAVVPECVTGTKDAMMDEEYQVSAATGDIYTPATDAYVDEDDNDVDAVDEIIHSANAEHPETLEDGKQWRETTPEVIGTRSVPDMQGIDQSKLVPLLVASLQEALTEIASLRTKVEALEAG